MQTPRALGVKLRTKLGHAVFIDDVPGSDTELLTDHGVEIGTLNITTTAFVSSCFHGGRASRKNNALRTQTFDHVQESEGGAEQANRRGQITQTVQIDHSPWGNKLLFGGKRGQHVAE